MTDIEKIKAACERIEKARAAAHECRCSDGGCLFRNPNVSIGMQTNGGCKCLYEIKDPNKRIAIKKLTFAANEITKLTKAVKDLSEALSFQVNMYDIEDVAKQWQSLSPHNRRAQDFWEGALEMRTRITLKNKLALQNTAELLGKD